MAKKTEALSQQAADVRKRERDAVELRNAGLTYEQIADRVGYKNPEGARQAILRCYERNVIKDVEEIRSSELQRLDALWQAVYVKARKGDERAVETALKILAQRRKYIGGLEAPEKVEVTIEQASDDDMVHWLQGYAAAWEDSKKDQVK